MDRAQPPILTSVENRSVRLRSLLRLRRLLVVAGMAAGLASVVNTGLAAPETVTSIELARDAVGLPPANFEFQRSGDGDLGQWTVPDQTAVEGLAIEHLSTDRHEDRFPLAVYRSAPIENAEVTVRFKILAGTMRTAGIAVGLRDPGDYYAVSASALEQRVDLLLFRDGKITRIESRDADVFVGRWHLLGVTINDDHFTISLDQRVLFTAYDRSRNKDGHVALWTSEDNITRFDQIRIRALAEPG
jgi:hypothetical protein